MTGASGRRILLLCCGLAAMTMAGCADMDILPSWVPFQGAPSDELPGVVTPAQRITQLRELSNKAGQSSEAEKQRISQQLAESIKTEKDPLIRMEIIRTLGRYPGPAADAILKAALADADTHVREIACEAWGRRRDADAVKTLGNVLQSDVDTDVRLAAAKALGETRNKDAVAPLGEALSDNDPAIQYRAVLSLEQVTGKDLGENLGQWQQYVKGEHSEPPSLAERIRHWF
jgi:HEAT repeat protein